MRRMDGEYPYAAMTSYENCLCQCSRCRTSQVLVVRAADFAWMAAHCEIIPIGG